MRLFVLLIATCTLLIHPVLAESIQPLPQHGVETDAETDATLPVTPPQVEPETIELVRLVPEAVDRPLLPNTETPSLEIKADKVDRVDIERLTKDALTATPSPESPVRADWVFVDKSARKMYLMHQGKVVREYYIALGGRPQGHKLYEGDERTPEGIYTLDYKNEASSYYRSMHINYPNEFDIERAQKAGLDPGGMIMVHGQKGRHGPHSHLKQATDWTDGCIALTNPEMDEFMELVQAGTPIEIEW